MKKYFKSIVDILLNKNRMIQINEIKTLYIGLIVIAFIGSIILSTYNYLSYTSAKAHIIKLNKIIEQQEIELQHCAYESAKAKVNYQRLLEDKKPILLDNELND